MVIERRLRSARFLGRGRDASPVTGVMYRYGRVRQDGSQDWLVQRFL